MKYCVIDVWDFPWFLIRKSSFLFSWSEENNESFKFYCMRYFFTYSKQCKAWEKNSFNGNFIIDFYIKIARQINHFINISCKVDNSVITCDIIVKVYLGNDFFRYKFFWAGDIFIIFIILLLCTWKYRFLKAFFSRLFRN